MPITFATPEAAACYEKGLALEAAGEYAQALENLTFAAEAEPKHPELWYRIGELLDTFGNHIFSDGKTSSDPKSYYDYYGPYCSGAACPAATAEELYWRGKADYFSDNGPGAFQDLRDSVALDPTNADAWFYYGLDLTVQLENDYYTYLPGTQTKHHPEPNLVLDCFSRAIGLDSLHAPNYLYERARFYRHLGRFDEALADYNACVALHRPGNAPVTFVPGHPFHLMALEQPTKANVYFARGRLFQQHDRLTEAEADYTTSLSCETSEKVARARGRLRLLAHDFKGAIRDFGITRRTWYDWRSEKFTVSHPAPDRPAPADRWEAAVVALEKSGIPETEHPYYLQTRCEHHFGLDDPRFEPDGRSPEDAMHYLPEDMTPGDAQLALADAEVLVFREPSVPYFRELRIACLLALPEPDLAVLTADYAHILQHTVWASQPAKQGRTAKSVRRRASHTRVQYLHRYAWALFNTGNHAGALASFAEALADPSADEQLAVHLPPWPDEAYILWQLRNQLSQNPTGRSNHLRIQAWMKMAIRELPTEMQQALQPASEKYWFVYTPVGWYFAHPRTAEDYSVALAACATGAEQVAAIAGILGLMSLNILKGQLRQAMDQESGTETSRAAALAHYDTARATLLAKWTGQAEA